MKNRLRLHTALGHCIDEIEEVLQQDILEIKRVSKIYGSNANAFIISTANAQNNKFKYILKYGRDGVIDNEVQNTEEIKKYLPTPDIILHSKIKKKLFHWSKLRPHWILFKYIEGYLMSEILHKLELENNAESFIELEKDKEKMLASMYEKSELKTIEYTSYLKNEANKLFYKRLCGTRFKDFYETGTNNISQFFDIPIAINGQKLPRTINNIFSDIKKKYDNSHNKEIIGILGHGDASHGNIIYGNRKIWFIDNEYSGYISPAMEISKPYHTDFIGLLFYFFHDTLRAHFEFKKEDINNKRINIIIQTKKMLSVRLKITKIKIKSREKWLTNKKFNDILTLNDYLVMCHTLARNPNTYPHDIQMLFLAFTCIMAEFNPLEPESIYDFF